MEKELQAFQEEINTLTRMVNGYIQTNPVLKDFVVDTLSIAPTTKKDTEALNSERSARLCKTCYSDEKRKKPYCYYGPNGCPPPWE